MTSIVANHRRPRVVIVGAGFGGLVRRQGAGAARRSTSIVIDRHNYHLFQPLLYQVATAGLSPADIASPIRGILRRQNERERHAGEGRGRRPRRAGGRSPTAGAFPSTTSSSRPARAHAYFGHDDWASLRAGPEEDRRRDRPPPPDPARLRAGRDRAGRGRAAPAAHLRRDRRRPDRRRDGRRHRRTRASGRWPPTSAPSIRAARAHRAGRGGAAPAGAVRPGAVGGGAALAGAARRRGAARRPASRTATARRDDRRASASRRAP